MDLTDNSGLSPCNHHHCVAHSIRGGEGNYTNNNSHHHHLQHHHFHYYHYHHHHHHHHHRRHHYNSDNNPQQHHRHDNQNEDRKRRKINGKQADEDRRKINTIIEWNSGKSKRHNNNDNNNDNYKVSSLCPSAGAYKNIGLQNYRHHIPSSSSLHKKRSRQPPPSTMRTLIVLAALVAAASAQIHASSVAKAKKGCDFGVPINGDIGWVKVPCDKTNQAAKAVGLGEGVEFLGSSRLSGVFGAESYAIHGKIEDKCCSQRVTRIAGTATEHPFTAEGDELCCHETCPTWMEKC